MSRITHLEKLSQQMFSFLKIYIYSPFQSWLFPGSIKDSMIDPKGKSEFVFFEDSPQRASRIIYFPSVIYPVLSHVTYVQSQGILLFNWVAFWPGYNAKLLCAYKE